MDTLEEARSPAEIYDAHFVPALFAQWGRSLPRKQRCDRVLDVPCGTGALTLALADIVGPAGSVIGLNANPQMLAVARRKPARIEWLQGSAEALPLPDNRFDAVVSQFGFMFFEDKPGALREMMRVLKSGGRLAVAVCDAGRDSSGYSAFTLSLDRLFGRDVGDAFRVPFSLGDSGRLHVTCQEAGIENAEVVQRNGTVRFKSIDALVSTERACAWTLGGVLTDEQFERLLNDSKTTLRPFVIRWRNHRVRHALAHHQSAEALGAIV